MEQNFFEPYHFYKSTSSDLKCASQVRESNMIPKCINNNFCVATPKNRNDGILAMAFVDMQPLDSVYPEAQALCNGTLFPNLNMPFYGGNLK